MRRMSWNLVALFTLGVATVLAQQPGGQRGPGGSEGPAGGRRPPPLIEALDADHDHVISVEELKNATSALQTLDKNNDGKLTEDEFRDSGGRPGPGDSARGGPAGGDRGFEGNSRRAQSGERGGRGRGGRPGLGGQQNGRPGEGPDGGPSPERMVEHAMEFDDNKDGRLSKDELMKFAIDFQEHHPGPEGPPRVGEGSGERRPQDKQRPQRPD